MALTILGRNQRLRHLLPEARELRITGLALVADHATQAGFSLDRLIGAQSTQTRTVMVNDDSLLGFGIYPGDRLIVDQAGAPELDSYVLTITEKGDYSVRLLTLNDDGRPIYRAAHAFTPDVDSKLNTEAGMLEIVGVVLWVISYVGRG